MKLGIYYLFMTFTLQTLVIGGIAYDEQPL